ncbi:MAG: hypothetical protein GY749_27705 [Desulfobacteraceae bacterium]|nr:hypothetical protein [Desulfobacteraceae bacterium]
MTPKEYETLRNELIELLQRATALDSVNRETRNILSQICTKTRENQFDIVLVGEFQGGKSTTFNALCDGRELSPLGSGIKTSGCIIASQNISESGESEKALVEWRNSDELVAGFSDLLLPHLQNIAPEPFETVAAYELSKAMNLNTKEDCRLVAEAVEQEWQVWNENKAGYDPDQKGKLDILRSASIIAHYCTNDILNQYRQQHEFKVEDIGRLAVFPQDWEKRWKNNEPQNFDIEEILFTFIKRIRLRLHSENLGRLGCVIVDCPGLFASRWDTEIARSAMFDADAILYLFDGSRAMRLPDLRALQFVQKNGMENKLFYSCNMRGHTLGDSERILHATVEILNNNGFKVCKENIALYHALLALRSVQGKRMTDGSLSSHSKPRTPSRLKPRAFSRFQTKPCQSETWNRKEMEKKILRDLTRQIMLLDIDNDDFTGLDEPSFQFARRASGLDNLMEMVEQTVIEKRARSILIDNGSQVAANSLLEVEETSHNRELTAMKKEDDFKQEAQAAREKLKKFEDSCFRFLEKLDEEGPDYILAEDLWKKFKARRKKLYDNIAARLYNEVHAFFRKKKLESKISVIIREEIDNILSETISEWITEIQEGKSASYNSQISRIIKSISEDLKRLWQESALPGESLLKGIIITEFSGNPGLDDEKLFLQLHRNRLLDTVKPVPFEKLRSFAGLYTAASVASLSGLYAASVLLTAGITTIIPVLVAIIIECLVLLKVRTDHTDIGKKLTDAIKTKIDPLFYEIEEDVKYQFRKFVKEEIREKYKYGFQKIIKNPRVVFEERIKQAEADFRKSRKEREAIAQKAKRFREEQIRPLRISLQNFVFKVEHYLSQK